MAAANVVLLLALAVLAWTDFWRRVIPNVVVYPAVGACVSSWVWDAGLDGLVSALGGMAVCGGLAYLAWRSAAIGGGDVKLVALIGAGLGWMDGLNVLLWTSVVAALLMLGAVGLSSLKLHVQRGRPALRARPVEGGVQHPMFLAPAALAAVIVTSWPAWPL
ncbi:MAG TPA: A24 family peptidase [Caulifigura sp.]|jgi:Flp pilus assembly protein protease CpaA|nr:A24 family peptidase [Caulifigura sp.]